MEGVHTEPAGRGFGPGAMPRSSTMMNASPEIEVRPYLTEAVNRLLSNSPYSKMYDAIEKEFIIRSFASYELPADLWTKLGEIRIVDLWYTKGTSTPDFDHLVGVSTNALVLGEINRRINDFDYDHTINLGIAGLLHDIKKPGDLTHRKGGLDEDEWLIMKRHPTEAVHDMIRAGITSDTIITGVRDHHQWINEKASKGKSYPTRTYDDQPTLEGRIEMEADVTDVTGRGRPYRKDPSFKEGSIPKTIEELKKWRGIQFDAEQVNLWIPYLERAL